MSSLLSLQRRWNISYSDDEKNDILKEFEMLKGEKMEYIDIYNEFLSETKIDEGLISEWVCLPMNKDWEPVIPYSIAILLKNGGRLTYTSKNAPFNKVI